MHLPLNTGRFPSRSTSQAEPPTSLKKDKIVSNGFRLFGKHPGFFRHLTGNFYASNRYFQLGLFCPKVGQKKYNLVLEKANLL